MDSPWEDIPKGNAHQEVEWTRISTEFTNAGYREGITSGKESTLQEGFDAGFADFGAPLGRDLGIVRGLTSAILAVLLLPLLQTTPGLDIIEKELITNELQDISSKLSRVRCSDVVPPDLEAEAHARLHLDDDSEDESAALSEELAQKKDMEGLEDIIERMSTTSTGGGGGGGEGDNRTSSWSAGSDRSSVGDIEVLKIRLKELAGRLGLKLDGV